MFCVNKSLDMMVSNKCENHDWMSKKLKKKKRWNSFIEK